MNGTLRISLLLFFSLFFTSCSKHEVKEEPVEEWQIQYVTNLLEHDGLWEEYEKASPEAAKGLLEEVIEINKRYLVDSEPENDGAFTAALATSYARLAMLAYFNGDYESFDRSLDEAAKYYVDFNSITKVDDMPQIKKEVLSWVYLLDNESIDWVSRLPDEFVAKWIIFGS